MSTYSDLNLLFQKQFLSADIVKNTDEAAIKSSVVNLITTKNYERKFHPEMDWDRHLSVIGDDPLKQPGN